MVSYFFKDIIGITELFNSYMQTKQIFGKMLTLKLNYFGVVKSNLGQGEIVKRHHNFII